MNDKKLILPIFPLPVFILPDGITRLRIFESRYLKMIKIATKGQGFVIWSNYQASEKSLVEWGSWVNIINFDQGDDGVLEIDVKCSSLVKITDINQDADNLHFGEITKLNHWSQSRFQPMIDELSSAIEDIFESNILLSDLYTDMQLNNVNWVVARWLELLPVDLNVKSSFVAQYGFVEAKEFVQSIIMQNKEINLGKQV